MEIIDFHAHIYPEKIAVNAIKGIGEFYSIKIDCSGTADNLVKNGKESGFSIITLKLFISDKGYAKIVIALARGKKEFDKRQSISDFLTISVLTLFMYFTKAE